LRRTARRLAANLREHGRERVISGAAGDALMRHALDALRFVRSLFVSVPLVYLATVFWGTLSLLCSVFDSGGRMQHGCARWWARTLLFVCRVSVAVRGLEHVPPGQSFIFAANHQSYLDIPVAFGYLPGNFRIMAKASLFHIPFLGWHLQRSGHLPIPSGNPRRAARSVLAAAALVRAGMPVFVFPEGGRSMAGPLREFKPGTFLLAIKAGVPVIPVTLNGTRAALAPTSWNIHPAHVELILHPPIPTEGMHSDSAPALCARVREIIAADFASS
jgi:1-acyl-sn-glycerol-3-phosphate acyltransferase